MAAENDEEEKRGRNVEYKRMVPPFVALNGCAIILNSKFFKKVQKWKDFSNWRAKSTIRSI